MTVITDVTCIIPSTLIAIYNSIELYRTVQLMIMSSRAKSRAGKSYQAIPRQPVMLQGAIGYSPVTDKRGRILLIAPESSSQ
jgi:hypothetical protein